ncbi:MULTISPECIES: VWA domain-containing protein [Reinekea]|uniref:VWA domain-containing protein n=1 Tax=Reinekea TaxID=230494 RepID=UPI002356DCA9|nr:MULTISPECIES: VWA domain-containing protein [Reinekea]MDO7642940.1 VWA domain-containing protein [Reinekea forsetii]
MRMTLVTLLVLVMLAGCMRQTQNPYRGVYLLLDTSGTYTEELEKAQRVINYYLGSLGAGDSFAVARIDSGSFSEKDIIAKVTFDGRPSQMNAQKREFAKVINLFIGSVESAQYTDISGGLLQAVEFLNETNAGQKSILIYSDLREELPEGYNRNFSYELDGFQVFALNVTKLREDNIDPSEYLSRLTDWQAKVEQGGGQWQVVNDLDRIDALALD